MKKIIKLALMLIIISIAACNKKDSSVDTTDGDGSDAKWPVLSSMTKVGATATSITVKISIASTGNYPLTKYGVYVGVGDNPLIAGATGSGITVTLLSSTANDFTLEIKGLTASHSYPMIAWVSNKYQASQKHMSPYDMFRTTD